jgi:hypothetical protein
MATTKITVTLELGNSLDSEFDDHHPWLVGVGGIKGVFEEWKGMVEWRGVE